MYDLLESHVERVELAHAKELRAIATAAVKTDRIDAKVLANLARLNFLPTSYAAPQGIRDLRLYMRHREWLVRQRTQAKNRMHAVLASYNLVCPLKDLFGAQGRAFLDEVLATLRPTAQRVVADNLSLVDHLSDQIEALEADLELSDEQKRTIRLLKTMPGVGPITATTILAEIGDIQRFNSPKALCHWAGLTPRVHKSDQVVRHGHITKQGSPYLRAAMTRAAASASRFSRKWYRVHENLLPRCGKKGAKVAVARRLLTVIYFMLKRQQPYQENYPSDR
jgi:transposase